MLARCIKQVIRGKLREKMRQLKQAGDEPYKRKVIQEFNLVFGKTQASQFYWRTTLKELVMKKFDQSLTKEESQPEFNFKDCLTQNPPGASWGTS